MYFSLMYKKKLNYNNIYKVYNCLIIMFVSYVGSFISTFTKNKLS